MSGTNGGIWRSEDTGKTWQLMLAGNATDVLLNPIAAYLSIRTPTPSVNGNLQIVYAGMEGQGVFMSPNQGQVWNLMAGGIGNPLIVDVLTGTERESGHEPNPNGAQGPNRAGRAGLQPAMPCKTHIYGGWLYAAVSTPTGGFDGLFMTKDFGQNWTQVNLATLPPPAELQPGAYPPMMSPSPITRSRC